MAKGDTVTREYYGRRSDGVDLYRCAVPNVRSSPKPMGEPIEQNEDEYWQPPEYEITQDQTGLNYPVAIDVENSGYTYTETDIPVEGDEPTSDAEQKAEAFDYLTGRADSE